MKSVTDLYNIPAYNQGSPRERVEKCIQDDPTRKYGVIAKLTGISYPYAARIGKQILGARIKPRNQLKKKATKNVNPLVEECILKTSQLLIMIPVKDRLSAIDRIIFKSRIHTQDLVSSGHSTDGDNERQKETRDGFTSLVDMALRVHNLDFSSIKITAKMKRAVDEVINAWVETKEKLNGN